MPDHDEAHHAETEPRWKHDGVRVIEGDQLDPNTAQTPGMFRQAAVDLSLDLARSWTIGDKERDVAAGRNAGIGTLVQLDEAASGTRRDGDVWVVPGLAAAIRLLREESGE